MSTRKTASKPSNKPGASGKTARSSSKPSTARSSKPKASTEVVTKGKEVPKPVMVANLRSIAHPVANLRDGTQAVTPKSAQPYRVAAAHNQLWWAQVTDHCKTHHSQATVKSLTDAGVPGIFISYCLRRGWLLPVTK